MMDDDDDDEQINDGRDDKRGPTDRQKELQNLDMKDVMKNVKTKN